MWYSTKRMEREVADFKSRTGNLPPEMADAQFREEAEAGWARIEECVMSFKAGANILGGGRFDTLSLGTWMEIVAAADLEYVPAEMVALAKGKDVLASQFAPVELKLTEQMLKYRGMVRLDFCGCEALKQKMSVRGDHRPGNVEGAIEQDGKFYFAFDDRTLHGLLTYVGQVEPDGDISHPIWWRPWVKALPIEVSRPRFMGRSEPDVWPLEWRAIVQHRAVAAISAYYPQAPVALTDQVADHVRKVLAQSETLLAFMRERGIQPWHPRYLDEVPEDEVSFSFDFISTPSGPAFLEAGPRVPVDERNVPVVEWGAHPCNFMDKVVAGVALSRGEVLPLDQFR